ncbi:MAG TPA: FHA domain-containing protein [Gemmataceae bacterium]|nr:FHA domain-containing protein [Gemmataceae bacterium]
MLGFAWVTLRQAQEALQNGRLDEAHRLLREPTAQGHKGTWDMMGQIAQGYVERGARHLQHDDLAGAWSDLKQAEQIGAADGPATELRQALTQRCLADAKALFDAGEPGRAAEALSQLRDRGVQLAEVKLLEEAARGWLSARDQADRGEFPQAVQSAERVARLLSPVPPTLERFQKELEDRRKDFADLLIKLHEAAQQEHWREVIQAAEHVLALAPLHAEARKVRSRAWKAVEPPTVAHVPQKEADRPESPPPAPRFLLWIDGIGGYLLCLGNRVTLGQATPDAVVDVPFYADVSRLHAALTRDAEGYLLEALRPAQVNGKPADKVLLRPGDRITLGPSCQLQFRQSVPVSATARLDLVSGHRLPLSLDGVLLMAETLVLGPGPQAHVTIPDLKQPIVLYRHKDGLAVRCPGHLTIDGHSVKERGPLSETSRVFGEEIAFALEPVGTKLGKV